MPATVLITFVLMWHVADVDRGTQSGRLNAPRIKESSGVAAGRLNRGMYWTHNDSGDGPNLYLIDAAGWHHGTWHLEGAGAVDWEDMCSFSIGDTPWLAVGDVGDNRRRRPHLSLYLLPEPALPPAVEGRHRQRVAVRRRVDFTYREGPRDCEGIGFDPVSRHFVIVTKQPSGGAKLFPGPAAIYLLPWASTPGEKPRVLKQVAKVPALQVTAADVQADGTGLLLLTYRNALWLPRAPGESWAEAIARRRGRWIPMPFRRQGEAVCFDADGKQIFLTSEGAGQPLWRRMAPPSPEADALSSSP